MLEVRNLCKHYGSGASRYDVLRNISCKINKGDVVGVIGPSGCGKTTFIHCLMTLLDSSSGEIWFNGQNILAPGVDLNAVRKKMGMVFQDFNLFGHLTVLENIILAPMKLEGMGREEAVAEAMRLLKLVGLSEHASHYPDELSGGQKQRVAIARCLAMKPEIIFFDEPTSALDTTMKKEVASVINRLSQEGMTMVIVTHEHKLIQRTCNRVFFFCQHELYEEGSLDDVFGNPKRMLTRSFVQNIFGMKFTAGSRDFDLYALNSEIDTYCHNNNLQQYIGALQHVAEEMLTNILPFTGPVQLLLKQGYHNDPSFTIIQQNCMESIVDRADLDEISLSIVKGLCNRITDEQMGASRQINFEFKQIF